MGTALRKVQHNKCCNDSDPCPSAQSLAVTSNGCVGKTANVLSCSLKSPLFHCVKSHLHVCFREMPRLLACPLFIYLNLLPDYFIWRPASCFSVIFPCLYSFIPLFSTPLSYIARVLYKWCSSNPLVFPRTEVSSHLRSPWLLFSLALPVGLARSASGIQDRAMPCKHTYVVQHNLFSGLLILF